jgi:hypothetical protein
MSWADTLKATALATLAERTETRTRVAVSEPWSWNAHDVWLRRIRNPGEVAAQPAPMERSTPQRR